MAPVVSDTCRKTSYRLVISPQKKRYKKMPKPQDTQLINKDANNLKILN